MTRGSRRPGRLLLVVPSAAFTSLFFVAPLALLLVLSFGKVDLADYRTYVGWNPSNYARALDPLYLQSILRSLAMSATSTLACLVIGFPVALTLSRASGHRQRVLLAAVIIPLWTGFIVRTYAVAGVLADHGPLSQALGLLGLTPDGLSLLHTPAAVVIGMVYAYLPLMVLPLFVALERIEPAQLLAASDLGAGPWSRLRRVEIPLAAPGILAGSLLVSIPMLGEYVVPTVLGGGKTLMYGNVIAYQFQEAGDYPLGSALTVMMTTLVTVSLLVVRRVSVRSGGAA
ncbi:ABC transporter permease [Amycolatopsis sp. EV170708-02-1]|uniref:ABC transporter permease n=1 Tax=Amycolatopsis sp. EV170708-02-1 TaxID=2919322 RepID=UPI001F0BFC91|nr:ABC transporter permease [Amycolatopsis sp. EV170708-02-1]UMP06923.1 ABC transporter permease [Amycolatopsis sp. EV170708-02-1]